MHDIVVDELERHLSGSASRAFYQHLETCGECRSEVTQMDDLSTLLREFRFDSETAPATGAANNPEPSLGFYNKVTYRIVEHQQKEAWGLFSPGAAFFRRIAFASLLLLAGLGSFLVTRESSFGGADAAAIMAQHDPAVEHANGSDRARMLVTLANYHE
jgi:hypothetical protein